MKKFVWTVTLWLLSPVLGSYAATWDFANPIFGTFATQAELDTLSGITSSTPFAIGLDVDGSLIVSNDPSGSTGPLIDLDSNTAGTVIVLEAALDAAQSDIGSTDTDVNNIQVAADGTIYLSERDGNDEILVVTPGSPAVVTNLGLVPGATTLAVDDTNNRLFIPSEDNFGGDGTIRNVALPGGAQTTAATAAQIAAGGGLAAGVGLVAGDLAPDGSFVFWDEGFRGGSEQILTLTNPGASPTIGVRASLADLGDALGIQNLVIDPTGNIFAWDAFPATLASGLVIVPDGSTTPVRIAATAFESALGLTGFNPSQSGSLAVKIDASVTPRRIVLYLADAFNSNNIVTVSFEELGGVTPTPPPIPALTPWGLIAMMLLLVTAGALVIRRKSGLLA